MIWLDPFNEFYFPFAVKVAMLLLGELSLRQAQRHPGMILVLAGLYLSDLSFKLFASALITPSFAVLLIAS